MIIEFRPLINITYFSLQIHVVLDSQRVFIEFVPGKHNFIHVAISLSGFRTKVDQLTIQQEHLNLTRI